MTTSRRLRPAADVAIGYAADDRGSGIAFAAIHTGSTTNVVRIPFRFVPLAGLDGLEGGYAAVGAVAGHAKARGFGRVRIRLADARVAADLNGGGAPPKALAMVYVKVRCALHSLGAVRLEPAEPVEVRDLQTRAKAELRLRPAA
jgi:hypothetical protein